MEELMSIGAFATRTGLSVSALRFYDERGLLAPAEVDRTSGYRRYHLDQVGDGALIRDLRRLGMSLADITAALRCDEGDRQELIRRQLEHLEQTAANANDLARSFGVTTSTSSPTSIATTNPEHDMSTEQTTNPTVSLRRPEMARALAQVLPAAATDPELPHLMGVLIESNTGSIRVVATDRHRLAVRDLVPTEADGGFAVVVPAATLARWHPALIDAGDAGVEPEPSVTLSVDAETLELTGLQKVLQARLVPTTFPDYERVLATGQPATRIQVGRQPLLEALDRLDGDGELELSVGGDRIGLTDAMTTIDVRALCEGPEQRLHLDRRFARDATEAAVGAEVVLDVDDPLSPVVFRSADDGTFTCLVMPIKR